MSEPRTIDLGRVRGKNAYEYAKEGGYSGTEAEFGSKLNELISESVDTTPDVSGQIEDHNTDANSHADIREAINDLSFVYNIDQTPTEGSTNLITSGAVYAAIQSMQPTITVTNNEAGGLTATIG